MYPKKRFKIPTFIGLTRVSRVNTNLGNHLHISNGVTVLVNISHMHVFRKMTFLGKED